MDNKYKKLKIALAGFGKTGKIICQDLIEEKSIYLSGVIKKNNDELVGQDIGSAIGLQDIGKKIWTIQSMGEFLEIENPHVVIDFSSPEGVLEMLPILAKNNTNLVICSTGYTKIQKKTLKKYSKKIAIAMVPNVTDGVNILMIMARIITKMWPESDIEVEEIHHRHKKDISGTAKIIANTIKDDLDEIQKYKKKKKNRDIPIHSLRLGGIVSKHTVLFGVPEQHITITHESVSKSSFGQGSIKVAKWLKNKKSGYYTMDDVLDLQKIFK